MSESPRSVSHVLFLCSGNYYRSRYAELFFNTHVQDEIIPWRSFSRGLVVDRIRNNIGPISQVVQHRLATRGIHLPADIRFPVQLLEPDLLAADLIIAMKEAEHRPMFAERFPAWTERAEYWHIDDVDYARPEDALAALEHNVRQLIGRLSQFQPLSSS
jgi:protein-tyrosine phosphatase